MNYKYIKRVSAVALYLTVATFGFSKVQAQISPSYDAYADSVVTSSGVGEGQTAVQNAQNAVGAPDGSSVGIAGVNSSITLDMGQGEEGTGNLTLHSSLIQLAVNYRIEFLDANSTVIKTDEGTLAISTSNTSQYNYNYSDYSKAYRFVRITNLATGLFNLDAVEAANYIGKTDSTDTDNGGVPDRTENTNGTNPQNPADDVTTTQITSPTPTTTSNNDTVTTQETATTTSTTTDNTVRSCTDLLADETARANSYLAGALLFLLLFLLALLGMMYYRNKYLNRERPVVTSATM